ncbi:MAG: type II secretion system protein [Burkholderiales bacterium]
MKNNLGFSLVELAVVMMVIGLLLAGAMIPLSTQLEVRSVTETQRILEQIKESITGFAQTNGYLPCPALGTLATGATNAGIEDRGAISGTCNSTSGVVPWATLGVPEADAWGNRFSYWVVQSFADNVSLNTTNGPTQAGTSAATCGYSFLSPAPTNSSFALCSLGNLTVNTRSDTHATTAVAQNLPLVIISHGKNGYGAWRGTGGKLNASGDLDSNFVPDTNDDEETNATAGSTSFIYRYRVSSSTGCSDTVNGSQFCEFDDIVVWISSNLLISKMIAAGKLP